MMPGAVPVTRSLSESLTPAPIRAPGRLWAIQAIAGHAGRGPQQAPRGATNQYIKSLQAIHPGGARLRALPLRAEP